MSPLLPIAGFGLIMLLLSKRQANAATKPPAFTEDTGGPPLQPPNHRPSSEMSEALKKQMAEALGRLGVHPSTLQLSGAADADGIRFATNVVGQLEAEGFRDAANDLRKFVDQAARSVPTPPEAKPIVQAAPAGLTKEQSEYIARVMTLSRDPNQIGQLITWLKTLAPSPQRDNMIQMAQALALQLAAAQSTSATIDQIDQIIKSPGIAEVHAAENAKPTAMPHVPITPAPAEPAAAPTSTRPTAPVPAFNPAAMPLLRAGVNQPNATRLWQRIVGVKEDGIFGPATTTATIVFQKSRGLKPDGIVGPNTWHAAAGLQPPAATSPAAAALPSRPSVVPPKPIPQPVPRPALPEELAARTMIANLAGLQRQYGVKGAKGREDKLLVKKFQKLAGLKEDGIPGPATFILAAGKGVVDLPLVYYWPKTATAKTVLEYRNSLERIATKMHDVGRPEDGNLLRISAAREKGQSGINGPPPP